MKRLILVIAISLTFSHIWSGVHATVREPAVAGTFYPADSAQLAAMVRGHLERAESDPAIDGELIALIVPHAGLVYSGPVAAHSYRLLKEARPDNLILCGPSHRYPFQGIAVYGPEVQWKTPLGSVRCSDELCRKLLDFDRRIDLVPQAHEREHSLEVQLPYLQAVLDDFQIVPATMGRQDQATIDLMARALTELKTDDKTILIAATDWQHYRPASVGWKMDSLAIDCVRKLDPYRLQTYLDKGTVELCGGGPTVAVLRAAIAKGADRVKILAYGDSGDISGDKSSVVGYVAAAIYKSRGVEPKDAREEAAPEEADLSADDKTQLLKIARQSISGYLENGSAPDFKVSDFLAQSGAAFVTLKRNGRLRGCIGYTMAVRPLFQTVSQCAISAAVNDSRFPAVEASELDALDIEISVLTPLQQVESLDEIKVNRDGLMISAGNRRGLLLPQVATEYGWSRTEFLEQTCRKAGLPEDTYLSPEATLYRFQAIVFGEKELGLR